MIYIFLGLLCSAAAILTFFTVKPVQRMDMEAFYNARADGGEPKDKKKSKYIDRLKVKIGMAGHEFPAEWLLAMKFIAGIGTFAVFYVFLQELVFAFPTVLLGFFLPDFWLGAERKRRERTMEAQFPGIVEQFANYLRGGASFSTALERVTEMSSEPFKTEFIHILADMRRGNGMTKAVAAAANHRIPIPDFKQFALAVSIHHDLGGNAAETFSNIASGIKDREELQDAIRIQTAEGRFTAYFVGAIPLLLLFVMKAINPEYIGPSLQTGQGKLVYAAAFAWDILGTLLVIKMSDMSREIQELDMDLRED